MRTSEEVTMSQALMFYLSREGYSPEELERLLEMIKNHLERVPDGGYVRVKSLVDSSKIILIKRNGSMLEVM